MHGEADRYQLSHVYPLGSRINEHGHLEIGGCDTVELAAQFGTPAFIVAEEDLRARARAYRDGLAALHHDSDVLFASKAFPCTAVYRLLAQEGLACDVASGGELALALAGGFDPARIYLHGNAKSEDELREALAAGVGHVVLDSTDDIRRLERVAAARGSTQEVLLRVTPDIAGDTHAAISTGQADSKFGFSMAQARAAIDLVAACGHLRLVGLHCHIGSQLLELEPFTRAVAALATLGAFDVYNLGGGLGVAYIDSQQSPPVSAYLGALIDAARVTLPGAPRLLVEPGRSLVANSTVTLYTVQTVKRNISTWVAVDGGMSDNLRPMLYGARYEAQLVERPGGDCECVVAGKHCESGDIIVPAARLARPRAGDILCTPATGAYTFAMANNYNGALRPPVIFCAEGSARVVCRRETEQDLLARDVR